MYSVFYDVCHKKWLFIFRLQTNRIFQLLCPKKNMQKILLQFCLIVSISTLSFGQDTGLYLFTRSPQLVSYSFKNTEPTFSQGVSAGLGITHQSFFLELGSFILEGNSYGHYSFFGKNLSSSTLSPAVRIHTNVFGEVTNIPFQTEQVQSSWIYTSGFCFFPNAQIQHWNIGIPLCIGLAYQEKSMHLNSRFILNLSYSIK